MSAAVNRLTAAGKAARRRKATIYRDLYAVADAFAHCGKANSSATKNVSGSSVRASMQVSRCLYIRVVAIYLKKQNCSHAVFAISF